MRTKTRSIEQIIEEQVRKWQFSQTEPKTEEAFRPIVTISREPGSGGNVIGERLARRLDLDLFHQEMTRHGQECQSQLPAAGNAG